MVLVVRVVEPPPPQPAIAVMATAARMSAAQANWRRRAACIMAMKKLISASNAASQATITNGVARGCGQKNPGGRDERFVVSFATQEAPTKLPELSVVAP